MNESRRRLCAMHVRGKLFLQQKFDHHCALKAAEIVIRHCQEAQSASRVLPYRKPFKIVELTKRTGKEMLVVYGFPVSKNHPINARLKGEADKTARQNIEMTIWSKICANRAEPPNSRQTIDTRPHVVP